MQCITGWRNRQWGEVAHTVAVLGLVILALEGSRLESLGGWIVCPPRWVRIGQERRREDGVRGGIVWSVGWAWMRRSWVVALVRSETLLLLAVLPGHEEWVWLSVLPWANWLWRGIGAACPRWRQWIVYRGVDCVLEEASRLALYGLVIWWFIEQSQSTGDKDPIRGLCIGGLSPGSQVEITEDEEGIYHVHLSGEFDLHIDGQVLFYKRMLVIFLRQLETAGERRGSRRTRDGRTPVVRQQELEQKLDVPQPHISLWMKYWQTQDWRRLLSRKTADVLTLEVQQRVIDAWVQFPWWGTERLWEHLKAQGEEIPLSHVQQAAQESGWSVLRESLRRVYAISEASFRPRDEWLVSQLLAQVQELVEQLEKVGELTPEQRMTLADLEALSEEMGISLAPARTPLPWVLQLEHILFGHWEPVDDDTVRCLYCGTTHVSRKSKKPRLKRYVDEQGNEQTVEVYRYYCHNPACKYKTFTRFACPPIWFPTPSGRSITTSPRYNCTNGLTVYTAAQGSCWA